MRLAVKTSRPHEFQRTILFANLQILSQRSLLAFLFILYQAKVKDIPLSLQRLKKRYECC
tara:strand:+ start:54 stop:233 length:180 start_codon:yes stop_codon:yes gene_type:complete